MSEEILKVLDTPNAARYVGLSTSTMAKMRVWGTSPVFLKLGRRVVYRLDDLDDWLSRKRRRSTSEQA
jgi:predicted DNA-binding transcriptional regulator AlpA